MASQWPKPEGFGGDIDPFDLVDRFKEHFLSICRYTADNPTAIAPASYVMETMFQANKVVAVLAKNLSDANNARFSQPVLEPEPETEQPPANPLSLQDRLAVLSNMFEVKQEEPTEEPSAEVEEADEVAQELSTMDIFGPDLNPEDSEEDGDWGSESSEDDSDDDYYEYGSFGDDSEEEGEEEEDEDSEAQEDAAALEDDEDMEDEYEDGVTEEADPPAKDQMEQSATPNEISQQSSQQPVTRQEIPYVRIVWSNKKSPYRDPYLGYPRCDQFVQHAIQNSSNVEVHSVKILHTKWYYTSGDCDVFVATAAEKERLICNSESWLPFVDNAQHARIKNGNPLPKRPEYPDEPLVPWNLHCHYFRMTWVLGDGPYKGQPSLLLTEINNILGARSDERLANVELKNVEVDPYCGDAIVHASAKDVELLVELSPAWVFMLARFEEIEIQCKRGSVKQPSRHRDPPPPHAPVNATFRIRWHCANPLYKEYENRGIKRTNVWDMLHEALKRTGNPSLAAICFDGVDIKWKSGDIDVICTDRDRERAVEYADLWFPFLPQGEIAGIPGIFTPQYQTPNKEIDRRKSNASKRNLEDVSASQTNLSRSLSKSAKRKRQKIRSQQRRQGEQENQTPHMQVVASGVAI